MTVRVAVLVLSLLFLPGGCGRENPEAARLKATLGDDLLRARRGFRTTPVANGYEADGPPAVPPPGTFRLVRYPTPAGNLAAYVTPDPGDGKRRPALLWAHGGFGGIGDWLWDPNSEQAPNAYRAAGFVVFCPSWRGENDNHGRFELFLGEVDDLLAAIDYVARLPYVDARRIYLAGHSTGGTMALLGAEASNKLRAAFSFGGAPDLYAVVGDGEGYGNTPFPYRNRAESYVRSPIGFVATLRAPTFYFEGEESAYPPYAEAMERRARRAGKPFRAFTIKGGDHFNILTPLNRLVAQKIAADTGPTCNIRFTDDEVQRTFDAAAATGK